LARKGSKSVTPPRTGIAQRRAERRRAGWRRSDQRWSEIVDGAARVFSRLGYAQTALADVAEEVGINRATLYYYVGTKVELLVSVLIRPAQQITVDIKEIRALDASPRAKLEVAIAKHMQVLADNRGQLFAVLAENAHLVAGIVDCELTDAADEYGDVLTEIIADGMAAGEFRDDIDPQVAMLGIVGMCNWTHRWHSPKGAYTLPDIGEQFSRMVVGGLAAAPALTLRGREQTRQHGGSTRRRTRG
jgi:TetR/AcrR family transcriptional regulator, cholesterol catabolism regulator